MLIPLLGMQITMQKIDFSQRNIHKFIIFVCKIDEEEEEEEAHINHNAGKKKDEEPFSMLCGDSLLVN